MKKILLASSSPRRRELLGLITPDFTIQSADADETIAPGTPPIEAVEQLSRLKAGAGWALALGPGGWAMAFRAEQTTPTGPGPPERERFLRPWRPRGPRWLRGFLQGVERYRIRGRRPLGLRGVALGFRGVRASLGCAFRSGTYQVRQRVLLR